MWWTDRHSCSKRHAVAQPKTELRTDLNSDVWTLQWCCIVLLQLYRVSCFQRCTRCLASGRLRWRDPSSAAWLWQVSQYNHYLSALSHNKALYKFSFFALFYFTKHTASCTNVRWHVVAVGRAMDLRPKGRSWVRLPDISYANPFVEIAVVPYLRRL